MSNPLSKDQYSFIRGYVEGKLLLNGYKNLKIVDIIVSYRWGHSLPSITFVIDGPMSPGKLYLPGGFKVEELNDILGTDFKHKQIIKL